MYVNIIVNRYTIDDDDYTTEPVLVSDIDNDGELIIPMETSPATESFKDGDRTGSTIPHFNMALVLGSSSFATFANYHLDCTAYTQNLSW